MFFWCLLAPLEGIFEFGFPAGLFALLGVKEVLQVDAVDELVDENQAEGVVLRSAHELDDVFMCLDLVAHDHLVGAALDR